MGRAIHNHADALANEEGHPILFFDGECNLCNSTVDFVIHRDRKRSFRYAALGSPSADRLLPEDLPEKHNLESFILLQDGKSYVRSEASLRVARWLPFPWKLCSLFLLVPSFLRDPVYRFIARRRYEMFGKRSTCRVPSPEERELFL